MPTAAPVSNTTGITTPTAIFQLLLLEEDYFEPLVVVV